MHAHALETLEDKLQEGCVALDVGSGSGKVVGIEHIKELVDLSVKNINKHHAVKSTVDVFFCSFFPHKKKNIYKKYKGFTEIKTYNHWERINKNKSVNNKFISFFVFNFYFWGRKVHGDGRKGYKEGGPYDCIHVGAAAHPDVPPILCEQLKDGGIMVTPVETNSKYGEQIFRIYKKKDGKVVHKDLLPVRYSITISFQLFFVCSFYFVFLVFLTYLQIEKKFKNKRHNILLNCENKLRKKKE
ncbi:protein-l-isoaspartate o-methyltransferase [Reticulomyxa filosa]|uniref:protein-L-isoaspartate(D-aspartate) O-methyltransferase n=1 Tax=Reticulomyxa filosa TaxID=46433 RepID=X6P3Q4_RETFI|nr:protein-l-isoaspartate o-methyltransferase [Reticulomyxa filosa]|eukprot:ETO32826.1 protein-l-isoaspartate o-methyltransferase [Reticulomyxa filosa]